MNKLLSIIVAGILGIICISPPQFVQDVSGFAESLGATRPTFKSDYYVPIIINSFAWLFAVLISGLIGFYMLTQRLHPALKFLSVYLFIGCFFSEVPYFSFTAYIILSMTFVFFLIARECQEKILIDVMQSVFWLELTLASLRLMGMDTLMNYGRPEPVFFGTIVQHMRFASLLCILSPFLILRSKWYIIPVCVAAVLCTSSGFALSILAGILVYVALKRPPKWLVLSSFAVVLPLLGLALWLGRDSFAVAFREGRFPIWMVILKSWVLDTKGPMGSPDWLGISQTGPFDLKTFLFGHGLDTFYAMFPVYKHDGNSFAQAHNCWIQIPWEVGLAGLMGVIAYCTWLCFRLYKAKEHECLAGLAIIGTNMIPHFPTRMTQTMWLIVAFIAICERRLLTGGRINAVA